MDGARSSESIMPGVKATLIGALPVVAPAAPDLPIPG